MHRAGGPQQPLSGSPKRLRPASTVSFSRLPVPSPRPLPAPAHSLAPVGGPVLPLPSLPSPSGRCPQVPIELPGTTTSPPPLHPCTLVQRHPVSKFAVQTGVGGQMAQAQAPALPPTSSVTLDIPLSSLCSQVIMKTKVSTSQGYM